MSERRWILGLAVLVAVVLGGWLLVSRTGGARGPSERSAAPREVDARPAEEPVPSVLAASGGPEEPEAVTRAPLAAEPAPAPDSAADSRAEAPPAEFRLVDLVEGGTLRPVPEAEVWFLAWGGDWNTLAFERLTGSAGTRQARTDAAGRVRIPWPAQESVLVLARSGALCGGGPIAPPPVSSEVARLELWPDWGVAIEVEDAAGRPAAGVPVALTLRRESWNAVEHARTDADGRAAFAHVGLQFQLETPSSVVVGVALPLEVPLERRLTAEPAPSEPLRFRLPPGGEVALTLLDRRGEPVADETRVQLGLVRAGEMRDVSPFGRERARMDQQSVGGRVRFEHVELGAEVELIVTLAGTSSAQREYFPGPVRAGERVERTLRIGRDLPVLRLRAVDEAGAALAETELELVLEQRSDFLSHRQDQTLRTDREGRFEFELAELHAEGDQRHATITARAGALGATLDLARVFEPGLTDLGDVVLARAPLLVAGIVRDAAGMGVADARVRLELSPEDAQASGGDGWESSPLTTTSGTDGAFALHGLARAQRTRTWAELARSRSDTVEAEPGARDVTLLLRATGSLVGSLRLDPGLSASALAVRIEREGAGAPSHEERSRTYQQPLADGRFHFQGLLPGRYALVVGIEDDEPELVRVAGVEVRAGEACSDARIQGLDLRGRLHAVRLVLRAPEAEHGLEGLFAYHAPGESGTERWRAFQGSPVEFLTAWERVDGTLTVQGFRRVVLAGVAGEREVELVPALAVRLVLPTGLPLPEPPVHIKAVLVEPDSQDIDWSAPVFDAQREIVCRAPAAGRLRVCWIVERRSSGGASATTLAIEPAQYVEVREQDAEQRFELELSGEALRRALADVGGG